MPTKPKARPRKPPSAGAPGASLTQRVRSSKIALLAVAAAIAAIAGVVTWQVEAIWETIGYGAAAAAAMAVVVVIALARRHLLGEHWYRFLGALFLGFTAWGALAFYLPESGALAETPPRSRATEARPPTPMPKRSPARRCGSTSRRGRSVGPPFCR